MRAVDNGYEVELDTTESFATALLRRAADTSLAIAPPLKPSRQYWWRVRGRNGAGAGTFSDVFTFRTAGTTSVDEELSADPSATFEVYDVLGRIITSGSIDGKDAALRSIRGPAFIIERDLRGAITARTAVVL
jgi:hypothetical protein